MGTNFYLGNMPEGTDHMDPEYHIGKRSSSGPYCWDCGRTLCKGGDFWVHQGGVEHLINPYWASHYKKCAEWFSECPICGKAPDAEGLDGSATGRELGFNKKAPKRKTGVRSCSSFTWAMFPNEAAAKIAMYGVVDEYGRKYTANQFKTVLRECPIQFFSSIGEQFS